MCLSRKNRLEVTSPAIVGLKAFLDSFYLLKSCSEVYLRHLHNLATK